MKFCLVFILLSLGSVLAFADQSQKVIYGDDNRQDLHEVSSPLYHRLSKSTAALFNEGTVSEMTNGDFFIQTTQYGEQYNLCSSEPFFTQRVASFCSAFLVAPDIMATAGHCVTNEQTCAKTQVVFNYAYSTPDKKIDRAAKENVYHCHKLIAREYTKSKIDFALFQLDRPVKGITPLKVKRSDKIHEESEFVVMGYPMGLPLKITDQAFLRKDETNKGFFTINSDTYMGNSGSAVINARSGVVEGILVRGAKDLIKNKELKCNESHWCKETGCRGEDVTASFTFAHLL